MGYPVRNPFPSQAVLSMEGLDWAAFFSRFPTFERVAMLRLAGLVERYLGERTEDRIGRAAILHGDHGTGKTHCLVYALTQGQLHGDQETPVDPLGPIVLYARADSADWLALYRKLMSRFSLSDLRALAKESFAGYAVNAFNAERPSSAGQAQSEVASRLRDDPDLLKVAIDDNVIPWTSVLDHQEKDMARIEGRVGNFDRVVQALESPELSSVAHRWMTGAELASSELRALGVQENIASPLDVRTAIQIVGALARHARRPLLVAIDQAEGLLLDDEGNLNRGNAGFLRALIEGVLAESGFIIIATNEDSWQAIPKDLRQRFGPAHIAVLPLSQTEARGIVAGYLQPLTSIASTWPLDEDAIDQLLAFSGGNARGFLQACHVVYYRASSQGSPAITKDFVSRELAESSARVAPSETRVRASIERTLTEAGLVYSADSSLNDIPVDYLVMHGRVPMVAVQISDPIFGEDEADQAAKSLHLVPAASQSGATVVLVVVGYSSPDVVSRLKQATIEVLVADGAVFDDRFRDLLARLTSQRSVGVLPDQAALHAELQALRKELSALAASRQREEREATENLREVSRDQVAITRTEELKRFRTAWLSERQRAADEITQGRRDQQRRDLVEMANEFEASASRSTFRWVATCLVSAAAAVTLVMLSQPVLTGLGVAAAAVSMVALMTGIVSRRRIVATRLALENVDEISRLVSVPAVRRRRASILSAIPYERYAAVVHDRGGNRAKLQSALDSEPCRLIRIEIARRLCSSPEGAVSLLASTRDVASLSVAVECASRFHQVPPDVVMRKLGSPALLDPAVGNLAAFYGGATKSSFTTWFLREVRRSAGQRNPNALIAAYQTGNDESLLKATGDVAERVLRQAVNELSPSDGQGVGSFYWLEARAEFEEIYLFFRKAEYLSAMGVA